MKEYVLLIKIMFLTFCFLQNIFCGILLHYEFHPGLQEQNYKYSFRWCKSSICNCILLNYLFICLFVFYLLVLFDATKTLERPPMLTFAVRTTPKQMRGILRAQVHPTSECVVTFSVPPIILGMYLI